MGQSNTATSKSESKEKEILRLIHHIPEEFLIEGFQKMASKSNKLIAAKVKNETSFYTTIFYKKSFVKSRTISSILKENNQKKEEIEKEHIKFFTKFSESVKYPEYYEQDTTCAIKIGEVVFIVQNHNIEASRLFAFILASTFISLKSWFHNKEGGSLEDLFKIAKDKNFSLIRRYLTDSTKIAFGQLKNQVGN